MKNRWESFSPQERELIRVLIQNHANSVSEISLHRDECMVGAYLAVLEELENDIIKSYEK